MDAEDVLEHWSDFSTDESTESSEDEPSSSDSSGEEGESDDLAWKKVTGLQVEK